MMSNNKILTVSYGTFSCTLEGFEDSFGTMKAIAEYFRDLAQDDRYFGAEPPQPDAEMLARIAEREIARRVQAKLQDGTVVLRAEAPQTPDAPETPAQAAPAPETARAPARGTEALVAGALAASAGTAAMAAPEAEETEAERAEVASAEAMPEDAQIAAALAAYRADTGTPVDAPVASEIESPAERSEDAAADAAADAVAETAAEETPEETPAEDDSIESGIAALLSDAQDAEAAETAPAETTAELDETAAHAAEDDDDDAAQALDDAFSAISEDLDAEETADAAPVPDEADDLTQGETGALDDITDVIDFAFTNGKTAETAEDMEDEADAEMHAQHVITDTPAPQSGMVSSIAAKLQRIRDVVARNQNAGQTAYSEDEHAEEMGRDLTETTGHTVPEDLDAQAGQTPDFDAVKAEFDAGFDEDLDARTARAEPDFEDMEIEDRALETIDAAFSQDAEDAQDDEIADAFARIDADLAADLDAEPEDAPVAEAEAGEADAADAPTPVQVMTVNRGALDAEMAQSAPEEVETDLDAAEFDAAEPDAWDAGLDSTDSALSPEDEAELLAELAAVEAEFSGAAAGSDVQAADAAALETGETNEADAAEDPLDLSGISAVMAAEAAAARAEAKASKRQKAAEAGVEDSAMDRLMAEAETQMEDPGSSSRRAAFDQLRAAVVATKGDDALSAEAQEGASDNAYRSDLEQAVVPRRPQKRSDAPYTGKERRTKPRPAPLKLVAEQRVDTPDARTGPVRPRRVATEAPAAEATDAASFADYAAKQGAHSLPDLLEAAASYLSFVEGHHQFSRPQLMTKVRQVGPKDFTREDGLRSFGQLLRAGKIEKIKGGRFTVSDEIGFQPEGRKAG